MEKIVKRLITDANYRKAFLADPRGLLETMDLPESEKAALARLATPVSSTAKYQNDANGALAMVQDPASWI